MLAGCAGPQARESEAPRTIRVLSWNLHHGEGLDGRFDLERIARVIRSVNPDWVALQEIDRGVRRTNGADMPGELARLTGLHPVFGDNIDYQGGRYGNLVLVRVPPDRTQNHALPSHYAGEQRGLLEVAWSAEAGQAGELRFFATHWDYRGNDDAERRDSVELVRGLVSAASASEDLCVLAGDLNAMPDSRVIAALATSFAPAHGALTLPTYPAGDPTRQIDYVWVHPPDRWRIRECYVLDEATASDHRPLLAVIECTLEGTRAP